MPSVLKLVDEHAVPCVHVIEDVSSGKACRAVALLQRREKPANFRGVDERRRDVRQVMAERLARSYPVVAREICSDAAHLSRRENEPDAAWRKHEQGVAADDDVAVRLDVTVGHEQTAALGYGVVPAAVARHRAARREVEAVADLGVVLDVHHALARHGVRPIAVCAVLLERNARCEQTLYIFHFFVPMAISRLFCGVHTSHDPILIVVVLNLIPFFAVA